MPGSARVSRVGDDVSLSQTFLKTVAGSLRSPEKIATRQIPSCV